MMMDFQAGSTAGHSGDRPLFYQVQVQPALVGRCVAFVGEVLFAYDAIKIGSSAVGELDTWKPKPAYIDTGVPW